MGIIIGVAWLMGRAARSPGSRAVADTDDEGEVEARETVSAPETASADRQQGSGQQAGKRKYDEFDWGDPPPTKRQFG